jgi:hypothetical protein
VAEGEFDAFSPANISPLVAYLAHESCKETGGLFEVGGPDLRRSMRVRTLGPPTHDHRTAIGATVEPLPP